MHQVPGDRGFDVTRDGGRRRLADDSGVRCIRPGRQTIV
jgi:hypothetical protein